MTLSQIANRVDTVLTKYATDSLYAGSNARAIVGSAQ